MLRGSDWTSVWAPVGEGWDCHFEEGSSAPGKRARFDASVFLSTQGLKSASVCVPEQHSSGSVEGVPMLGSWMETHPQKQEMLPAYVTRTMCWHLQTVGLK